MFSDFTIESYSSAQEMADVHFMFDRANGNFEEDVTFSQTIIHNAESRLANYSQDLTSDLANLGPWIRLYIHFSAVL
jgi:hypothetical protein